MGSRTVKAIFLALFVPALLFPVSGSCADRSEEEGYWAKVNPIGKPPAQPSENYTLFEQRFEAVKNGRLDPMEFFRLMGSDRMTMRDAMAFKEEFIRLKGEEIQKIKDLSPIDALPLALESWNGAFGQAERKLMDARRKGVERAFTEGVRRYIEARPDFPYIIRMDTGASSSEAYQNLRLEGDIDISTLASQVENAVALRDCIASAIRDDFGLDMRALDALMTAHRQATFDVYITQPAADWAEMDALRRGRLQEIVIEGGEVRYRDVVDPVERVFIFANMKNNIQMRNGSPDQLARLMDEPPDRMTVDMEPAVSLEMLRHMTTDAVQARLAYHEKILKLAKYVDRSVETAKGALTDTALAAWARQVTLVKQNQGMNGSQRLKRILELSAPLLGNPRDAAGLDRAILSLGERASVLIRDNISKGIDARMKRIDETKTPSEKEGERRKLLTELEQIFTAYVETGVDFPPKAHDTMLSLADVLKVATLNIPASELERMKRYLDMSAEKPDSLDLALATAWRLFEETYTSADAALDAFNEWIDYLDNHTVARLRAMNPEFRITAGGKTHIVSIPIGRINDRLNASMLATVGNSLPFKAIGLAQELNSYVEAFRSGKSISESVSNVATELFRSRVPAGDIVEAVVMEKYTRAAIGVVHLFFPTLAVPEALYGMGNAAAEWYVGTWQQWQYDEMVDELYEGTVFKLTKEGIWEVKSITYTPPVGKTVTVGRDELFTLPERVPKISNILVPQVRNHPSIAMYHELLARKELSDGQSGIPCWPRRYLNLSRYGERLYEQYVSEVRLVTKQYFGEVITELVKRKAFDQGTNEKEIKKIGEELGCGDELLEQTGSDRASQETVIAEWKEWKKVHAALLEFRVRWGAYYILVRKPACSPRSIRTVLEEDREDLETVRKALQEATVAVEEIVGRDGADEKKLQPAVRARAGAMIYPSGSPERRQMIDEYRKYLDSLRDSRTPLRVRISGPDTLNEGTEAVFSVLLDREIRSIRYDWKFASGGTGETLQGEKTSRILWTPASPGKSVLEVHVLADHPGADWVRATHPVTVLSREETPRPRLRLTCPVASLTAGEVVPLTAETEEFGLGGEGFERYIWFADGRQIASTAQRTVTFDGVGYEGRTVEIRVEARTKSRFVAASTLSLEVLPPGGPGGDLRVSITPDITEIAAATSVRLSGMAFPRTGGGSLQYQWSVNGEFAGDKDVLYFDAAPWEGKTVEIAFYAAQVRDGMILFEGTATKKISVVKDVPVTVAIAPHPSKVDDTVTIRLSVKDPLDGVEYEWREWNEAGRRWSDSTVGVGREMVKSARGLAGQSLRFLVTARDGRGRTASAESGLIEVVEPTWLGPDGKQEEVPSEETTLEDPKKPETTDEGSQTPGSEEDEKEELGAAAAVRLELPPRIMVGETFTARVLLPEELKAKKALSFYWQGGDPVPGADDRFAVLEGIGGENQTKTTVKPEAQIVFLPGLAHKKRTLMRVAVSDEDGHIGSSEAFLEVLPMGFTVTAPEYWKGYSEDGKLLLRREADEREQMRAEGILSLEATFFPEGSGHSLLQKDFDPFEEEMWSKREALSIDGYNGYMGIAGPAVSLGEPGVWIAASLGKFGYGSVRVGGIVVKGPIALEFTANLDFDMADIAGSLNQLSAEGKKTVEREAKNWADRQFEELRAILLSIEVVPDPKRFIGSDSGSSGQAEGKKEEVVLLKRLSPVSGPVPVGAAVEFLASAEGAKKGEIFFRFEPSEDVSFSPQESEEGRTKAVFSEPGRISVWAVALDKDKTLGESERMEIEVTGPELHLVSTPSNPKVGQEVQVKAEVKPGLPEGAFVVWTLDGKSSRKGAKAADTTEYSFRAEEPASYVVKAKARSPEGETIAEGTVTIGITEYEVTTTVLGPAGPRPQEWVEGHGLRTVEKDTFLRDEHVRVKAEVKDPSAPKDLRWKWIPGPETSMVSSSIGQEATLYGTAAGTASARVEVRDTENLLLGAASVSFSVMELPPEPKAPPLKGAVRVDPEPGTVNGRITLSASGEGGKPPYTFRWGGPVTGSGDSLTFIPERPGTFRFTLLVADSAGRQVTVNRDVEVKPFAVTLSGLPQRTVLGETVSCRVDYPLSPPGSKVNRSPVPRIRLSGSPVVEWNPGEGTGPGFSGRAARPGVADIRAEVRGSGGVVLGLSDPVQVTVGVPDLSLALPEYVIPGDSFRASVKLPSAVNADEIFYFSWKAGFPVSRQYGRDGGSALVGPVSGLDPVPVSVVVRDKGGKTAAELSGTVPVRPLDVSVMVQAFSERGQIVLPDGRVDYPPREEWIEGQTVTFKAAVSSARTVTWEWSLSGPGKISQTSLDTASVILNGTGTLTVTIVAKVEGKEAGRAEMTLPVTVAKNRIQAAREYLTGQNEWNATRRDQAIIAMERAESLDPGNPAIRQELDRMKGEMEKLRAEDARERAVALWNEAAELQKKEKYEEALEKYREGLAVSDDKGVREHVRKLEEFIARRKQKALEAAASARARAEALWNEAAKLQNGKQYEQALQKYREGLAISPDPVVEDHVRKLEEYIARMKKKVDAQQPKTETKSEPEQQTQPEVQTPSQPVHSGLGFAGAWSTEWGKLVISVNGNRATGTYPYGAGRIEGTISSDGRIFSGMWTDRGGSGKVVLTLSSDGNSFTGVWGYGKETPSRTNWTGTRISSEEGQKPPTSAPSTTGTSKTTEPVKVTAGEEKKPSWGGWKTLNLAGIRYAIPASGFQSVKSSSGTENGKYPYVNYDYYMDGKRVAIVRIGTLQSGMSDERIRGFYTGKGANKIFDSVAKEGKTTLGGRSGYYLQGDAPGVTRRITYVSGVAEGGHGAYLHVVAGQGSGWKKYSPMFDEIAGRMTFTAGKDSSPAKPADEGAGKLPKGWKPVTIGNVTFGIPSSWSGKTMNDHNMEKLYVYWEGNFNNPVHGVSGGVTTKYDEAKRELRGARTVSLGGAKVLRADEEGVVNLLFPPMGNNRGVALLLFRGKGGKQEVLETILKTFAVK